LTANGQHPGAARDRVFLTGATGFVGSHIQRELLAAGYAVRALVRPATLALKAKALPRTTEPAYGGLGSSHTNGASYSNGALHAEHQEFVPGDLNSPGDLVQAMRGCRYLIHCAALYSFAPRDRAASYRVNVVGTEGLMEAAYLAGVERGILTSSSATLGHAHRDRPADENDYALEDPRDAYHHSKVLQERVAFASRLPVIAVLPTGPVGPNDWKPTQTGKMILDYARGKMFAKPPGDGGMNLVAVEDVARAHVAALERGRIGERYVIGGENFTMDGIWETLASITGIPAPKYRAPYGVALAVAYADRIRCLLNSHANPFAPLEGVRMSRDRMFANDAKARAELGHMPTSARAALERAVSWYHANGYTPNWAPEAKPAALQV
jgi:dihydroflavonol-4-reductase